MFVPIKEGEKCRYETNVVCSLLRKKKNIQYPFCKVLGEPYTYWTEIVEDGSRKDFRSDNYYGNKTYPYKPGQSIYENDTCLKLMMDKVKEVTEKQLAIDLPKGSWIGHKVDLTRDDRFLRAYPKKISDIFCKISQEGLFLFIPFNTPGSTKVYFSNGGPPCETIVVKENYETRAFYNKDKDATISDIRKVDLGTCPQGDRYLLPSETC